MLMIHFVPLTVLFAGALLSQRPTRVRLAIEFLRPYSRTQLIRGIGLVVAGSATLFVVLSMSIPVIGLWIHGDHWPNRQIVWTFVAVLAWTPLFLAAAAANLESFESIASVIACLVLYLLYLLGEGVNPGSWPAAWFSAVIFAFGLWALISAYRSWLNNDVA
jgi:hypothetical protein